METDLFEWKTKHTRIGLYSTNQLDFTEITLKIPMGEFPAGTQFDSATICDKNPEAPGCVKFFRLRPPIGKSGYRFSSQIAVFKLSYALQERLM